MVQIHRDVWMARWPYTGIGVTRKAEGVVEAAVELVELVVNCDGLGVGGEGAVVGAGHGGDGFGEGVVAAGGFGGDYCAGDGCAKAQVCWLLVMEMGRPIASA